MNTHVLAQKKPSSTSALPVRSDLLQRRATGPEPDKVPPIVDEVLSSGGQPLDPDTRSFMAPRFGHDFSRVRVHTDAAAGESARTVNARAFTVGQHIVFAPGRYAPNASDGRQLLAHELVHTLQQRNAAGIAAPLRMTTPNDSQEAEADRIARGVSCYNLPERSPGGERGAPVSVAPTVAQLARQPELDTSARATYIRDAVDKEALSRINSIEELREREREGLRISEELFRNSAGDDVYKAAYTKAYRGGLAHGLNPIFNGSELNEIATQAGRKAIRDLFMKNRADFHGKFWDEHLQEWEKQQQQAANKQAERLRQEKLSAAVYDVLNRVSPTSADADKAIQLLELYFAAGGTWLGLNHAPLHRLLGPYGYRFVEGSGGHTPGENVYAWQQSVLNTALFNWRQSTNRQRKALRREYWASEMRSPTSKLALKYQQSTMPSEAELQARNAQEVAGLPLPYGGQYSGQRGGYIRAIQQAEVSHALEQIGQIANAGPASLLGRALDGERGAAVGSMIDAGLAIRGGARARAKVRAYNDSGGLVAYGGPGGAGFEPVSGPGVVNEPMPRPGKAPMKPPPAKAPAAPNVAAPAPRAPVIEPVAPVVAEVKPATVTRPQAPPTVPQRPGFINRTLQKLYLSLGMTLDEVLPEHRNIAGGSLPGKLPTPALIEKAPVGTSHEVAPTANRPVAPPTANAPSPRVPTTAPTTRPAVETPAAPPVAAPATARPAPTTAPTVKTPSLAPPTAEPAVATVAPTPAPASAPTSAAAPAPTVAPATQVLANPAKRVYHLPGLVLVPARHQKRRPHDARSCASCRLSASRHGTHGPRELTAQPKSAPGTSLGIPIEEDLEAGLMQPAGKQAAGMAEKPQHHIFPRELEKQGFWRDRGFAPNEVDKYCVELPVFEHQAQHGGGNPWVGREWKGEWNSEITVRILEAEQQLGRKLIKKEVLDIGKQMQKDRGIDLYWAKGQPTYVKWRGSGRGK